jgi:hypothetical protein
MPSLGRRFSAAGAHPTSKSPMSLALSLAGGGTVLVAGVSLKSPTNSLAADDSDDGAGVPRAIRSNVPEMCQEIDDRSPKAMRLYLVRHGQSENNVLAKDVEDDVRLGRSTRAEALQRWFRERSDDPDLTALGFAEAANLARNYKADIAAQGGAALACSPMLRALKTIQVHPQVHTVQHHIPTRTRTGAIIHSSFASPRAGMIPPLG